MGDTVLGNRYEIIRKIGDGGMAFVYEAKDKLLNRTVAVKVLRPEFVDDEEFLAKFKREAEAVASLSHSNIVNVYDVGEDGKVHYIVMEFIDGQNLKEIIKNEGTLDEYTALDITKQIALALSAAHKKGIIHRDIKPHNILISNEGRVVKVADFGIAKAVSNSTMTNIGSIIGSVHYFSPEQAKGKFVTNNADLYSLGIVLYEMLIGKVPFRGDSPISIALQHINDDIEFTSEEKVNIPQSVRTIIKKLTEKSSSDRYQSAEELIEDIEYIEKNIDLDFIKEYDNYATKKIDNEELNESRKTAPIVEFDDNDEDEDDYDELMEEEEMPRIKKGKSKKKKQLKEDSPKTKKRLRFALVVLSLILVTQVFVAVKLISGGGFGFTKENKGVLTAPDLTNMSLEEANRKLKDLDLDILVREEYNADVEKDHVIYQMPVAGTEVNKGDTITVTLSRGAKRAEVPSVVGLTLEEAKIILKDHKLEFRVKEAYSEIYRAGVVLDQSPKAGLGTVEEGDKITLTVSKGPEEIKEPEEEVPVTPPNQNNNGSSNNSNAGGNNTNRPTTPTTPDNSGNSGGTNGNGGNSGQGGTGGTDNSGNNGGSQEPTTPPTTGGGTGGSSGDSGTTPEVDNGETQQEG